MYEERKFKIDFNWKSLLIKLGILMLIVFVICFLIFRPKKENNFISLANNITSVKEGAINYFKDNMTLKNIGDYKKVQLEELVEQEYVNKSNDVNGDSCINKESYAYLTKVRDSEFVLKINLKCDKNTESQVFYLTNKDFSILADTKPENITDKEEEDTVIVDKEEPTKPDKEETDANNKPSTNKPNNNHNNSDDDTVIADKPNNKVLRYKHIKYGEWLEGNKKANNIENSTKKVEFYKYCFKDYCVIDRLNNADKYNGYTMTYVRTEIIPTYRYIYVIWSSSSCIKGFLNTGVVEYR